VRRVVLPIAYIESTALQACLLAWQTIDELDDWQPI
jgi:hypothetical protein